MIIFYFRSIYYEIAVDIITNTLRNGEATNLSNLYKNAAIDGKHESILSALDNGKHILMICRYPIILHLKHIFLYYKMIKQEIINKCCEPFWEFLNSVAQSCHDPAIAARVFANVANMLSHMAHGKGGLRSGPAANQQWTTAFSKLEVNQ